MSTLASRVTHARRNADLSQEELARRLGVNQSTISRIERGEREALEESIKLLSGIAKETGAPARVLFGYSEFGTAGSREHILESSFIPAGLKELAKNDALCGSLNIRDDEWHSLSTIDLPGPMDRDGWVTLLLTIRNLTSRILTP